MARGLKERMRAKPVGRNDNWRVWLIAGYAAVVTILVVLWGVSLNIPIEQAEEDQQFQSMSTIANAASAYLADTDLDAQKAADTLSNSGSVRITLIASDGTVLADSVNNASTMENHAGRPEVQQALEGQTGRSRRVSATDGNEYLYLAQLATFDGQDVILSVCVPISHVEQLTQTSRRMGFILLFVAAVVTVAVSVVATRKTSTPVTRLERVRTDFVANASHELKTPVAGIALLSESIEQAAKDGNTEAIALFSQRLSKESRRLQSLVTELLDLSRLESGGLKGRSSQAADLSSVVATSFEAHLPRARQKGLDFSLDDELSPDRLHKVHLSPADCSLIIDNLLENAISYTEEGSVRVKLTEEGDDLVLEVTDTGIGVPLADQERIFERFYRVDTARSREMGGTGLGLSLVRHAVNRADGSIALASTPGKGSTFTIHLPMAN